MKQIGRNKIIIVCVISTLGIGGLVSAVGNFDNLSQYSANADDAYTLNINDAPQGMSGDQSTGTVTTTLGNKIQLEAAGEYSTDISVITLQDGASLTNLDPISGMTSISIESSASVSLSVGLHADSDTLDKYYTLESGTVFTLNPTMDYFKFLALEETVITNITITYSCASRAIQHDDSWIAISSYDEYVSAMSSAVNNNSKLYLTTNIDFDGKTMVQMPGVFSGEFDGNGYSIKNYINSNHGLFNLMNGGLVKNLVVEGVPATPAAMLAFGSDGDNDSLFSDVIVRVNFEQEVNGAICATTHNPNGKIDFTNTHIEWYFPASTANSNPALFLTAGTGSRGVFTNVTYGVTGAAADKHTFAEPLTEFTKTYAVNHVELSTMIETYTVEVGQSTTLSVDLLGGSSEIEIVTSQPDVVNITDNGDGTYTITGVNPGATTITISAEVDGITYSSTVEFTVTEVGYDPGEISIPTEDVTEIKDLNSYNTYFGNGGTLQTPPTKNAYLSADIDLEGREINAHQLQTFSGIFEGAGHKIYNFVVNNGAPGTFFHDVTADAIIRNVTFEGTTNRIGGGFVCYNNAGDFYNVRCDITVASNVNTFGGIAMLNLGGTYNNCVTVWTFTEEAQSSNTIYPIYQNAEASYCNNCSYYATVAETDPNQDAETKFSNSASIPFINPDA